MASVRIIYRPLDAWPGEPSRSRKSSPFRSTWPDTIDLLDRELWHLGAREAVLQLALDESEIRRDGYPRANARPRHPGVAIAFTSRYGPLRYATDAFSDWQANVRAIALGLEALRKVDRYGITRRGEQYAGWRALPAGRSSAERGRELISRHGGLRQALFATHPDHGGDADDFAAVQAARGEA